MELCAKIFNGWTSLIVLEKCSIVDIWQGPKYVFKYMDYNVWIYNCHKLLCDHWKIAETSKWKVTENRLLNKEPSDEGWNQNN